MLLCAASLGLFGLAQVPEPPPAEVEVRWTAPPECPDREALLRGIAERRGQPLVPGQARIDGRITRSGSRYVLRLDFQAGARRERRELGADACAPLVDATALRIALAVDAATEAAAVEPAEVGPEAAPAGPPAASGQPEAPDSGPSTPAAEAAPVPVPPPVAEPLAPPPERRAEAPMDAAPGRAVPRAAAPGGLVRVHGGPEYGAVPGLSGAVGLAVGLLWPRLRLELQGTFVAPRRRELPQADLRAWLLAASVQVCARLGRGALEFPVCGGVEAGSVRGVAHGPTIERAAFGLWVGGVLSGGVAWRFHPRLALWAALQGVAAVRPSFQLRDPEPTVVLFEPSPVSGRVLLGLELRIRDRR
ncbi:hypothetical protein [Nannocystis radixulma]|uniref:DUF5683 domain-containing protein n=1 Tax=Nannocystis radixulma TaxID=2995305 RepID=A0ABT5BDZ5_9BACT|nr:hypothetical protein [Nannocystis radixulma]MDC0672358.1 hypothetical protein [Nannocystis radixulma]